MKLRYDYKCPKCNKIIEVRHSIKEDPVILCEECGGEMFRVVASDTNVVFKGAGWPDKMRRRGDLKYDPPTATEWT